MPEDLRAINLAAFEMIDYVLIDPNSEPLDTLKQIKPDFFAKGYEYSAQVHPKTQNEIDIVSSYGLLSSVSSKSSMLATSISISFSFVL